MADKSRVCRSTASFFHFMSLYTVATLTGFIHCSFKSIHLQSALQSWHTVSRQDCYYIVCALAKRGVVQAMALCHFMTPVCSIQMHCSSKPILSLSVRVDNWHIVLRLCSILCHWQNEVLSKLWHFMTLYSNTECSVQMHRSFKSKLSLSVLQLWHIFSMQCCTELCANGQMFYPILFFMTTSMSKQEFAHILFFLEWNGRNKIVKDCNWCTGLNICVSVLFCFNQS